MRRYRTPYLLSAATVLLVAGVVLPLLMVLHVVETSYFLGFLSYGATVSGAFLGYLGTMILVVERRNRNR
ncbi:MAG TPA: hypothetical protein ENK08_08070 [Chloroflexi bacterium]|nr:hypothetical protein [Chloroflexota bacterium]